MGEESEEVKVEGGLCIMGWKIGPQTHHQGKSCLPLLCEAPVLTHAGYCHAHLLLSIGLNAKVFLTGTLLSVAISGCPCTIVDK